LPTLNHSPGASSLRGQNISNTKRIEIRSLKLSPFLGF
jgi:hypothetical protein